MTPAVDPVSAKETVSLFYCLTGGECLQVVGIAVHHADINERNASPVVAETLSPQPAISGIARDPARSR